MGFCAGNMTHSPQLAEAVKSHEDNYADWDFAEAYDMTSTAGYDNDGSIGPELLDNGIGLAFACRDYDPKATIFFAFGGDNSGFPTCYYQYGLNEDDALSRLAKAASFLPKPGEQCEACDSTNATKCENCGRLLCENCQHDMCAHGDGCCG